MFPTPLISWNVSSDHGNSTDLAELSHVSRQSGGEQPRAGRDLGSDDAQALYHLQ